MTRFEELKQRLVDDRGMTPEAAHERMIRDIRASLALKAYRTLVDEISLKQLHAMGVNAYSLVARAHKVKKISKSKNVHFLANQVLFLLANDGSGLDALQKNNVNARIQTIIETM